MDDSIIERTFQDELNEPVINVPRAALRLARSIAFPILDVDYYVSQLNVLAERARPGVAGQATFVDRVEALSDFIFFQMNFRGNYRDYNDPRNSYLNCVLDRKLGIPISLATVYISVAQRIGMQAFGIGLPGHFVIGLYEKGSQILLDPFNGGKRISVPDCARLVRESTGYHGAFQPKWLSPVAPGQLLARMLTNLCNAYIQREDWCSAIPVVQHLRMVQPEIHFHLRDLGYLYLYNGSLRLSAQYLEEYLRQAPDAHDFEGVRDNLKIVAGRLALWN
jgi:regulator of sirC expression with transglutaminase-like and TPR domain